VFLFPLEELAFAGMPPSATRARRFAAHPGRVTCVTREMTSESGGTFRVTDAISDRLLRLPLYFGITDAQVDAVIDAVKAFYSKSA